MLLGIHTGDWIYPTVEIAPVIDLESEYKQVIRYREFVVTLYHLVQNTHDTTHDWALDTFEQILDSLNSRIKELGDRRHFQ